MENVCIGSTVYWVTQFGSPYLAVQNTGGPIRSQTRDLLPKLFRFCIKVPKMSDSTFRCCTSQSGIAGCFFLLHWYSPKILSVRLHSYYIVNPINKVLSVRIYFYWLALIIFRGAPVKKKHPVHYFTLMSSKFTLFGH